MRWNHTGHKFFVLIKVNPMGKLITKSGKLPATLQSCIKKTFIPYKIKQDCDFNCGAGSCDDHGLMFLQLDTKC